MNITTYFGNCERKLFVAFDKPRPNKNYGIRAWLINDRDPNPLQLTFVIKAKGLYGFEVELDQYTDSPNYAMSWQTFDEIPLVSDGENWHHVDAGTPPPFERKCSCEGHTLLHKGCQCGAVPKRKWGL